MRKFISALVLLAFLLSLLPEADARRGRSQRAQNAAADRYRLTRIKNLRQLKAFIAAKRLVSVGNTAAYMIDAELGEKDYDHRAHYMHARPWTKMFLDDVLGAAHAKFGTRYRVTSLVRTVEYQLLLCRSNGNAVCNGSSHLTGATFDVSYVNMSDEEKRWFRKTFNALQRDGTIIYRREVRKACFHVMVLPSYTKRRLKAR